MTGLELVLPDGSEVTLGGPELDHPGYDLVGAFVGSEGTLGIATRIWLRVIPKPEAVRTLVAFFGSTVQAGEVVSRIVVRGHRAGRDRDDGQPLDPRGRGATNAGYPTNAGAALVVELDGSEAECETRFEHVMELCGEADSVRVAQDEAERELIWRARKAAFAAMGRIAPNYYVQDSVIPRTELAEVLGQIEELAAEHELQVANVFHAGDGNLHPLVCYDGAKPGEAERAEELAGLIVKACVDAGGSITGEHGVGVDKKRYMPSMFDEPDLATFQRLRCAFDPDGRANPGKVMPTPRLCGEVPGPTGGTRSSRRARGAVLMQVARGARHARGAGLGARRRRGGGHAGALPRRRDEAGWPAGAPPGCHRALDRRAQTDRRAQRRRPDRRARGRRALAEAQALFAKEGQRLALDPPDGGATIGGVVASGDTGPLRRATEARATLSWACAWRCRTARSPRAAAR